MVLLGRSLKQVSHEGPMPHGKRLWGECLFSAINLLSKIMNSQPKDSIIFNDTTMHSPQYLIQQVSGLSGNADLKQG